MVSEDDDDVPSPEIAHFLPNVSGRIEGGGMERETGEEQESEREGEREREREREKGGEQSERERERERERRGEGEQSERERERNCNYCAAHVGTCMYLQ